jgi:hypothetical protein
METAIGKPEEMKEGPISRERDLVSTTTNHPFSENPLPPPYYTGETDTITVLLRDNLHHPPYCSLCTKYLDLY